MATKADHVQAYFEQPTRYLSRRAFEIRIRAETVEQLTQGVSGIRVLDIGCGDGSISLPLISRGAHVTLLDLSSSMLAIAKSKVPREVVDQVETVNEDFSRAPFAPQSFDLILCIGVLAHVSSPKEFIEKMVSVLKPNGAIIIECTDSSHILTRTFAWSAKLWSLFRPTTYKLNAVSAAEISKILASYGLRNSATFRYLALVPGSYRFFSQNSLYKFTRRLYGSARANRNAWLGNEFMGLFRLSASNPNETLGGHGRVG